MCPDRDLRVSKTNEMVLHEQSEKQYDLKYIDKIIQN